MGKYGQQAKTLPDAPGVYLFKDLEQRVIYVGKAASLRKRVSSYLKAPEVENPRLTLLRSRIQDIDFIVTANEVEALILEANLIKLHKPHFNVVFRDDKSYPYMIVCIDDTYPRVMFTRGHRREGVIYYGPFAHAGAVRETIDTLRKVFPFRACRGRKPGKNEGRPCLDYHMKLCSGPCIGAISPQEYRRVIDGVREFMEGDHEKILTELKARMRDEAASQEYEKAARTRDRLIALNRILERQQAHSLKEGDQDVFAVYGNDLDACVTVFYVRRGKILGKQDFVTQLPSEKTEGEILAVFLPQFYSRTTFVPREVLVSHPLPDQERGLLKAWLDEKAGRRVSVINPLRGSKKSLVEKVMQNAHHGLDVYLAKQASDLGWISRAVNGIYEGLRLGRLPYRVECYDISNLGPEDAVGSMVVYEGGLPNRKDFRRFRIKGVKGPNDVAMIKEVLDRRLAKLGAAYGTPGVEKEGLAEKHLDSFLKKPDLILVDGGEAQLMAALKVLQRWGFEDIDLASLAKRMEEVYLPGSREAIYLPRDSEALHLLQRIRDEAHRYALDYHRVQRGKRTSRSALDDVPGVGPKRKGYLLRQYGSLARIAGASLEELQSLSFLDKRTAENIYRAFSVPKI